MSVSTSDRAPSAAVLSGQATAQRRWLLWRAQKMAFWVMYDFAGSFVVLNLLTLFTVGLPAGFVAYLAPGWPWPALAVVSVMGTVVLAGQAGLIAGMLEEREFALRSVWRNTALLGAGALGLLVVLLLAVLAACLGSWFYWMRVVPAQPLAGYLLAAVCGGSGALVVLSAQFWLPALVHKQGSARKAIQTGFVLLARHPVLAVALALISGGATLILATPPGVLLLSALPIVALQCCVYELLARWYALHEALAQGQPVPASLLDENDIFLNRGFTDLLQPWKI